MRQFIALTTAAALALGVVGVALAHGDSNRNSFKAGLGGYQEVPAISTTGTGSLRLSVNAAGTQLAYTLTYSGLEGGSAGAAHLHLGQHGVNGGVVAFLCGGGGKPACPAAGVPVNGTIVAADITPVPAQGIAAGELGEVLRALCHGVIYANVHNATYPGGEIRGQIRAHGNGGKGDHD